MQFASNVGHKNGNMWNIGVTVSNALSVQDLNGQQTFEIGQDGSVTSHGGATINGGLTLPDSGLTINAGDLAVDDSNGQRIMTVNQDFDVDAGAGRGPGIGPVPAPRRGTGGRRGEEGRGGCQL